MKRMLLVLTIGCTVSLFAGAASAWADAGPHVKGAGETPFTCAGCHRAHTGKAPYLLKENQEALCFSCHGSTGTGSNLDVVDGVGYPTGSGNNGEGHTGAMGALRGGGFKYAMIESGTVEKEVNPVETTHGFSTVQAKIPTAAEGELKLKPSTSAHSVNETSQIAWGRGETGTSQYGAEIKLACGSCHDPHGNGNYRILRPIPTEGVTVKSIAEGATTKELGAVSIPEEAGEHVYTTTNYWASWSAKDPEFYYKISEWCALCHTRIYATDTEGPDEELSKGKMVKVRHPSYSTNSNDPEFGYRHRTAYTLAEYTKAAEGGSFTEGTFAECADKVQGSTCKVGEKGAAGAKPNCIQCHVSHGTDAKAAGYAGEVTFPNNKTTESPLPSKEDSFLLRLNNRGVCQTCHNK
jgi:predicted CXXCH cytochrome family protein